MAPLSSLQNCQVTKSNKTYTLRESRRDLQKDRVRSHELSRLSERDSQSMFATKKKRKSKKIKSKSQK